MEPLLCTWWKCPPLLHLTVETRTLSLGGQKVQISQVNCCPHDVNVSCLWSFLFTGIEKGTFTRLSHTWYQSPFSLLVEGNFWHSRCDWGYHSVKGIIVLCHPSWALRIFQGQTGEYLGYYGSTTFVSYEADSGTVLCSSIWHAVLLLIYSLAQGQRQFQKLLLGLSWHKHHRSGNQSEGSVCWCIYLAQWYIVREIIKIDLWIVGTNCETNSGENFIITVLRRASTLTGAPWRHFSFLGIISALTLYLTDLKGLESSPFNSA